MEYILMLSIVAMIAALAMPIIKNSFKDVRARSADFLKTQMNPSKMKNFRYPK